MHQTKAIMVLLKVLMSKSTPLSDEAQQYMVQNYVALLQSDYHESRISIKPYNS